jgi:kinesin family protein 2/24
MDEFLASNASPPSPVAPWTSPVAQRIRSQILQSSTNNTSATKETTARQALKPTTASTEPLTETRRQRYEKKKRIGRVATAAGNSRFANHHPPVSNATKPNTLHLRIEIDPVSTDPTFEPMVTPLAMQPLGRAPPALQCDGVFLSAKKITVATSRNNVGVTNTEAILTKKTVGTSTFEQPVAKTAMNTTTRSISMKAAPTTAVSTLKTTPTNAVASSITPKFSSNIRHNLDSRPAPLQTLPDTARLVPTKAAPTTLKVTLTNAVTSSITPKLSINTRRNLDKRPAPLQTAADTARLIQKKAVPTTLKVTPTNAVTSITPKSSSFSDDINTRRNLDKRSARLQFAHLFMADIEKQRCNLASTVNSPKQNRTNVSVYIRKRPFVAAQEGDFDVIHVQHSQQVAIYNTRLSLDMSTPTVQPNLIPCDYAFDEHSTNETVYKRAVQSMVQAKESGTVLMFGQTNSGKSHTMQGLEEHVAHDLFGNNKATVVSVVFLELSGKTCRDLLANHNNHGVVNIRDRSDGSVHMVGATTVQVSSSGDLLAVLARAKQRRATKRTDKNDTSSRSHAVCQLTISGNNTNKKTLTLVDCAGTERRHDSEYHSKERQAESTEINASLYALKQCIRAVKESSNHIPYRTSLLTRILREGLQGRLAVIATLAPNAIDTEHSLETCKTVSDLMGAVITEGETCLVKTPTRAPIDTAPKCWTHEQLLRFLAQKKFVTKAVPANVDGKMVMRMSKLQLRNKFFHDDEMPKANVLFDCLRAEADRIARLDFKRRSSKSPRNNSSM